MVNIVIDQAVYEAQLAAMVTDEPVRFDPADLARQRCCTTTGIPIDPADAVAASLVGQSAGSSSTATGGSSTSATAAASSPAAPATPPRCRPPLDGDGRCLWPGCGLHRCQIDHTVGWTHGGVTNPANSGPLCGRHNRFKTRGYRTWRDPTGIWHTTRPDGTEIIAA